MCEQAKLGSGEVDSALRTASKPNHGGCRTSRTSLLHITSRASSSIQVDFIGKGVFLIPALSHGFFWPRGRAMWGSKGLYRQSGRRSIVALNSTVVKRSVALFPIGLRCIVFTNK